MIDQNVAEFEKMNLNKWHSYGYKGKGSTIVVLDTNHKPYPHTEVIDPFNDNYNGYGHKSQVAQVIREIAPEARIVVFSWFKNFKQDIVNWIKEHEKEIACINCSFNSSVQTEVFEQLKDVDIPVVVSSGNEYKDYIGSSASYPWTISVGAWNENNDGVVAYSNYGEGLDFVAYTNIWIPVVTDSGVEKLMYFGGTSCSGPVLCGLLGVFNGLLIENNRQYMRREEAKIFLQEYSIDKLEEGYDFKSGHGLVVLPQDIPSLEVIVPEPIQEEEYSMAEFKDTQNHWAKPYIDFVADQGLMKGYEEGAPGPEDDLFRPDEPMTRAEVATVIARMNGFVKKK